MTGNPEQPPLAVGVDVAKGELVVAVWDAAQQRGQPLEVCANDAAGHAHLVEQVEAWAHAHGAAAGPVAVHLAVEPTGGYELAWVYAALARGWRVSVVNALTLRKWAEGLGRRAKTDRLDALALAQYTAERRPGAWQPPAPERQELDSLLGRRADLLHMLQAERNRLQQFRGRPGTAAPVTASLTQVLAALEQALAEIEQALQAWRDRHPPLDAQADRLDTLPGVGDKTVLPLLALLLRWSTLTGGQGTDKALTAFVGLDPRTRTSGTSVRKRPLISKQGDPDIRAALYMAVLGALRGRNALHAFYDALVARGKPKKVALVACMRKLLTWAWHLFITQQPYDPSKHLKPA